MECELIGRLRAANVVGVLSNMSPELMGFFGQKFGFAGRFDFIEYSGRVGIKKPETKIYEHLIERAGVPPSRIIFVDDDIKNVEAARKTGMHAVHFTSAEQLSAVLRELGVSF
ncbi:MAG: HAD-IA family hydrolase [Candidatus Micrarchaeota archaeon]